VKLEKLAMGSARIALFGCNALFREGLRRILEDTEFEVVLSSDEAESLLDLHAGHDDGDLLVIIDQSSLEHKQSEIHEIAGRIPGAKLVYLVKKFDLDKMIAAFNAGVHGYIVKDIRCESLIRSLQLIALGEKVLPGELIEQLPKSRHASGIAASAPSNLHELLSDREFEILRYLAAGFPNKVIATRLDRSDGAVKVHVKGILRKLNVNNRTQAAILAFNSGLKPALQDEGPREDDAAVPDDMADGAIWNAGGLIRLANVG
jgi:two-component system nitrate/nitrite response regulator NarL